LTDKKILNKIIDQERSTINDTETLIQSKRQELFALNKTFDTVKSDLENSQLQKEALQIAYVELQEKVLKLKTSEETLKYQHEELIQSHQELVKSSQLLLEKNRSISDKKEELEATLEELQRKAEELALTSRHKSEFLANMSHELRTPLNAILLLSSLLSENHYDNLNEEQIEFASVIKDSGNSLLTLIDEILDLASIESGKMPIELVTVDFEFCCNSIKSMFEPLAREKGLSFSILKNVNVPMNIVSDQGRLEQVLKNFISNSFKFTEKGSVKTSIRLPTEKEINDLKIGGSDFIVFEVIDTGIGIAKDKQALIFEAFKQAEGSIQGKYGGTGLGLSISREIAQLLGGEIVLESKLGKGSTFKLIIPQDCSKVIPKGSNLDELLDASANTPVDINLVAYTPDEVEDDRLTIRENDKVILIVDDDPIFAMSLMKYMRLRGYKVVIAVSGGTACKYAIEYQPTGILLDIMLPAKSGWTVMDELKKNKKTKNIPVHVMSSLKIKEKTARESGAISFMEKPLAQKELGTMLSRIKKINSKKKKNVLLINDNKASLEVMKSFLASNLIQFSLAETGKEAIVILLKEEIDCIVLDMLSLGSIAFQVLESIKNERMSIPVIIYTGKSISEVEEKNIKKATSTFVMKTAKNFKQLSSAVSLFLHIDDEKNSNRQHSQLYMEDPTLAGKKVLIIGDDARTIFSTINLLESHKMKVDSASDGVECIEILKKSSNFDLIIVDMMLPNKDGYQAILAIRTDLNMKSVPIIGITDFEMPAELAESMTDGANAYIDKPLDEDQLISLMRMWLNKL
jgi:signal transduction histidine kinase/CheY-like chemotaxis protein